MNFDQMPTIRTVNGATQPKSQPAQKPRSVSNNAGAIYYDTSKGAIFQYDESGTPVQLSDSMFDEPAVTNDQVVDGVGSGVTLNQAQIDSLLASLDVLDADRVSAKERARLTRDAEKNKKIEEREREEGKFNANKLGVLQDFGVAKGKTDINTRDTLEGLMSSLATLGMGGGRELSRKLLDSANIANRDANLTQAKDTQKLTTAWNEFDAVNGTDMQKIEDMYKYETTKADRDWAQGRQNTYYKVGDTYGAADRTAEQADYMKRGTDMNEMIKNSVFLKPEYTGRSNVMATPELSDFNQDVAQYQASVGGGAPGAPGQGRPSNANIRAIAVNDKDLGVKKKTEGDVGYGV